MDRLYADLDRGSAEMDRLMAGIVRPGDLRLVDILTLVWPEPGVVVVDGGGAGLLRVGDGDGLDLLGVEVDLDELGDGAANLKKRKEFFSIKIIIQKNVHCIYNFLKDTFASSTHFDEIKYVWSEVVIIFLWKIRQIAQIS